INFGIILAMVVVLFLVTWFAVAREQSAKTAAAQALEMADNNDHIRFQIMQNRLYLGNYLLSGDSREAERLNEGIRQLNDYLQSSLKLANSDQQRSALEAVQKNENAWVTEFAQPMLEKRKQVDSGNATVADLQIFYLQKDAASWVKNSTESLNVADHDARRTLEERRKADESAGTWTILVALLSTLIAVALGTA